jgi:O-methyltransferase
MLVAITFIEITSLALIGIALFLGFKILESNWSYTISKPFAWEQAVRNSGISQRLKSIERSYRDKVRFYNFWFQIMRLKHEGVEGAFAEVGVYRGETARIIHEMDPSRPLHLFDTFTGFDQRDLTVENPGSENSNIDFSDTGIDLVRGFIKGNEKIFFHPGYFPDTAIGLTEKFAFVHLDADLYQPTLAGLNYFYPHLLPGGVIIIHDYNHTWSGVEKAVNEFLATIPESLIAVPDWQGSVMIIRSNNRNNV